MIRHSQHRHSPKKDRLKLLVTSVGSLIGQNILDSVEKRRDLIHVIGTNSVSENPRNFRCDIVYLVHETCDDNFSSEFHQIISRENPDFILPGRDEDCIFLADLKERHPEEFKHKIPFGSSFVPKMMMDKQKSFVFCRDNELPYADTFLYSSKSDREDLNDFIKKHGFPLTVKPNKGFGSTGVFYVLSRKHVDEITKSGEALFQEYLGNPECPFKYESVFKKGIPLFFQLPEKEQYAAQIIIYPDGNTTETFFTINNMLHGRAEFCEQIFNETVESLVKQCASVFFRYGWYGPVNFQLKPDREGNWKIFELNPRLTGTSSGRALLGYDEFGILTDIFLPHKNVPNYTTYKKTKGKIIKYLSDNLLLDRDIEQLENSKLWKKFS